MFQNIDGFYKKGYLLYARMETSVYNIMLSCYIICHTMKTYNTSKFYVTSLFAKHHKKHTHYNVIIFRFVLDDCL